MGEVTMTDNSAVSDPLIMKVFFKGLAKYGAILLALHFTVGLDGKLLTIVFFFALRGLVGGSFIVNTQSKKGIYEEASDVIGRFVDGSITSKDWKSFLSQGMNGDARYVELQRILTEIPNIYPSKSPNEYCSQDGRDAMLSIAKLIRQKGWTIAELRTLLGLE